MNESSKKVIVFDFFGVICSEVTPFWYRKYFSDEEAKKLKSQYAPLADIGQITDKEYYKLMADLVHKEANEVEKEVKSFAKLDLNMVAFLRRLSETYRIALCSNSPKDLIRDILKAGDIEKEFDVIVISSECGVIKPDKKIFELVADKISESFENLIFIDDNQSNVDASKALGIKGILFSGQDQLRLDLNELGVKVD